MSLGPQVLSQNPHFVVVEKPAQWLSVPGRFKDDGRPVLGLWLQEHLQQKIWPVHRLDFEVSGVMLFAVSAEAHREANLLFEKQMIKKTYQALTLPIQKPFEGRQNWRRKILRGKKRSYESPHGDLAITEAEVFAASGDWRLYPQTGKAHQLRVEMALQGFPILGDALYGSTEKWREPGIALRAIVLDLPRDFAKKFSLPEQLTVPLFS